MYFEYPVGLNLRDNMPTILAMANKIKKQNYSNPGFVCTGSSGAIIAALISAQFDPIVPVLYIRKDTEKGHFHSGTSGFFRNTEQIIVIDDWISTGATIDRIILYLKGQGVYQAQGICLVNSLGYPYNLQNQNFFIDNLILEN